MHELLETVITAKYNYWAYTVLMMIGVWAMIGKNNLVKKVIGMNIFQTSIILFYVSIGSKKGATIPILQHAHGATNHAVNAADYINPLPHVLMLTAIVVSVATLGVALALLLNIYKEHKTLEEDEILKHLSE
ncbi:cation:proton antiporter subunit C [Desulfobaculum senezii]|jgi:multicomponent Na+:H+ antiporter subunit C|uniref:cation:proton antiporter subunit C n=1 Tax=Desulfobaculum sp. SPO524 TaxID=3378071 RepID=UPI0038526E49